MGKLLGYILISVAVLYLLVGASYAIYSAFSAGAHVWSSLGIWDKLGLAALICFIAGGVLIQLKDAPND